MVAEIEHEAFIELIRVHGVKFMGDATHGVSLSAALERGWNMTRWRFAQTPGATLFYRVRDDMTTDETRILCVNGPESDRERWEAIAREYPDPTIVLMTPVVQHGHFGHIAR